MELIGFLLEILPPPKDSPRKKCPMEYSSVFRSNSKKLYVNNP